MAVNAGHCVCDVNKSILIICASSKEATSLIQNEALYIQSTLYKTRTKCHSLTYKILLLNWTSEILEELFILQNIHTPGY